jgi:hypothetical protein
MMLRIYISLLRHISKYYKLKNSIRQEKISKISLFDNTTTTIDVLTDLYSLFYVHQIFLRFAISTAFLVDNNLPIAAAG